MVDIFKDITILKGVGEKRAVKYSKLGVYSPYELLFHFPRSYIDYRADIPIADAPLNESSVIKCTVVRKLGKSVTRNGLGIFRLLAESDGVEFTIVFFNTDTMYRSMNEGSEYRIYGRVVQGYTGDLEVNSPSVVVQWNNALIQPIYPLTSGLTSYAVQRDVKLSLELLDKTPFDIMPIPVREKYNLCNMPYAFHNIHFPESDEALAAAKRRFAFDELLTLQLGMLRLKGRNHCETGCKMSADTDISDFYEALPFSLTNAQKRVISEISADICGDIPMNRLVQGDVGSGKTAVAAAVCYFAFKNGFQSALMAPTEILASQHYRTLTQFLAPLGIKVALLTGSLTTKQKNLIKRQISDGEIDVIVGTHAIIQKDTSYSNLGLVITDEQHRFGVQQRSALAEKGCFPHKLVMSATPIPRTMGLVIYGDLDISIIDELPEGRMPVPTFAVTSKLRDRVFAMVEKEIEKGRQAYIVCPMIQDSDSDLQAVCSYADEISKNKFRNYNVGLLHGRMTAQEKEKAMLDFKSGALDILVCTTVVEVGVDIPNATVMVIENAERYGLSQLHQLRGRVGRGEYQGYCVLVAEKVTDECKQRLKVMCDTSDGFKISEEDLKLRGPGDFFGARQHGLPKLKIADVASDMELVNLTQECARAIIEEDAELSLPQHQGLRVEVSRLFANMSDN